MAVVTVTEDYINVLTEEEYQRFYNLDEYRSSCVTISRRNASLGLFAYRGNRKGRDALRFGPMRPVGIKDPRTEKEPTPSYSCGKMIKQTLQYGWLSDEFEMV